MTGAEALDWAAWSRTPPQELSTAVLRLVGVGCSVWADSADPVLTGGTVVAVEVTDSPDGERTRRFTVVSTPNGEPRTRLLVDDDVDPKLVQPRNERAVASLVRRIAGQIHQPKGRRAGAALISAQEAELISHIYALTREDHR